MKSPEPIYLTPKDLQGRWKVSLSTIYDYKDRGHLAYVLVCGCIRFRLEDIETYEQAGYVPAPLIPARLRGRLGRRWSRRARGGEDSEGGVPTLSGKEHWQKGTIGNLIAQDEGKAGHARSAP